jgi:hypothetical protein
VSNTAFEGGDDGHGYGDHTFLVKQAQPSHSPLYDKGSSVFGVPVHGRSFLAFWTPKVPPLKSPGEDKKK